MAALDARWRKSRHSDVNGACVEVRLAGDRVEVRDSKDRGGPVLRVAPAQWTVLVAAVGAGELS